MCGAVSPAPPSAPCQAATATSHRAPSSACPGRCSRSGRLRRRLARRRRLRRRAGGSRSRRLLHPGRCAQQPSRMDAAAGRPAPLPWPTAAAPPGTTLRCIHTAIPPWPVASHPCCRAPRRAAAAWPPGLRSELLQRRPEAGAAAAGCLRAHARARRGSSACALLSSQPQ